MKKCLFAASILGLWCALDTQVMAQKSAQVIGRKIYRNKEVLLIKDSGDTIGEKKFEVYEGGIASALLLQNHSREKFRYRSPYE